MQLSDKKHREDYSYTSRFKTRADTYYINNIIICFLQNIYKIQVNTVTLNNLQNNIYILKENLQNNLKINAVLKFASSLVIFASVQEFHLCLDYQKTPLTLLMLTYLIMIILNRL